MAEAARHQDVLITELSSIVGADYVLTDAASCRFYTQDIYKQGIPAFAVVQPLNTEELAAVIATTIKAGHAIVPRGGGMSYTGACLPAEPGSIQVDMRRMNRVLEINREDMYVKVECGCTWHELHKALDGSGLRTPFWGPLSGIKASIGGSLSQNGIFWGSGQFGSAADSVISLDVVLADGRMISTGSDAQLNGSPFFRYYGPDLTGLFTCDSGALGFKAVATLRLIPELPVRRFLSFDFDSYKTMLPAMSEISRRGIVMECFAFDPYLQAQRMQRESLAKDVKAFAGVLAASGSISGAIKDGARLALSGRRFMKDVAYSAHIMIEDRTEAGAGAAVQEVRAIAKRHEGKEIKDSIPKILRANPFTPLNNIVGPQGERWVPVHTLVPHSKAVATTAAVKKVFAENAAEIEKYEIGVGFLFATIATNGFVVEPVFFWPDEMMDLHRDTIEPSILKKLPGFEKNAAAREMVEKIRQELIDLFCELGGIHLQIAKSYNYREGIKPDNWKLIQSIKQLVDPDKRINPKSLGLD